MMPAVFDKTVVEISGGDYLFRTEGEVMKFEGYLKMYGRDLEENGDQEDIRIPVGLTKGENLELLKIDPKQNFTKPPAWYTESTLVKELDRLSIGRPSTYAQIITTVIKRKYVEKKQNKLHATELGETVNGILIKQFPDIFIVELRN